MNINIIHVLFGKQFFFFLGDHCRNPGFPKLEKIDPFLFGLSKVRDKIIEAEILKVDYFN